MLAPERQFLAVRVMMMTGKKSYYLFILYLHGLLTGIHLDLRKHESSNWQEHFIRVPTGIGYSPQLPALSLTRLSTHPAAHLARPKACSLLPAAIAPIMPSILKARVPALKPPTPLIRCHVFEKKKGRGGSSSSDLE